MTSEPSTPEVFEQTMLDVSVAAAREAAALHRERSGTLGPDRWSEKGTSDFVTEVDRESERRIVRRIRAAFPDDEILAEEGTDMDPAARHEGRSARDDDRSAADDQRSTGGTGRRLWIIDPLDGTTNWLHGYPEYAVSIAALDGRGLRTGVVLDSATGETFTAIRGHGARLDDRPIEVSRVSELRLALLGTGFPFKRPAMIPGYLRVLGRALRTTSGVRRGGSAALDLCDVACGRLDGFWEHWLMPWDVAAGALILREAGGTFEGLPGDGIGEATLAAAAARGADVVRGFSGSLPPGAVPTDGAAFVAGNGRIDGPLRELLEEVGGS